MTKQKAFLAIAYITFMLAACRKERDISPPKTSLVDSQMVTGVSGLYLLNEGNMNTNMASLDYYDYQSGSYYKNMYPAANPGATLGLGDVGNDIGIYGTRMYIVVNASNKVEVVDVKTAKRITTINIKNCRYVTFANGKAYVSAYDGQIVIGPGSPNGFVAEIDTSSLVINRTAEVGRQPEEMAIINNKLYVANSGGYSPPNYESTVSVIDLQTFKKQKDIDVAINLHRLKADGDGDLYITSRGDYYDIPSRLLVVDTKNDAVKKTFDIAASNIAIAGDSAYVIGSEFSYSTGQYHITYHIINTRTETLLPGSFIKDGTDQQIKTPYGIAVDPFSKTIYVTDATDYVSSGMLYAFDSNGNKKFSVTAGNIPAHMAFVYKTTIIKNEQ